MVKKIKAKIKLEDLDKDSTPCEICVAMNGREVETNENKHYFNKEHCTTEVYYKGTGVEIGGSGCTDVHKAQMRIEFLNYFEHKKSEKQFTGN